MDIREDGIGFIQSRGTKRLVAIDGEMQLAARHEAANLDPETKQQFVAVYINHGRDVTLAKGTMVCSSKCAPSPSRRSWCRRSSVPRLSGSRALTDAFGPAMENREHSLASSPTAMSALGAIGHPLINIGDPKDRTLKARESPE